MSRLLKLKFFLFFQNQVFVFNFELGFYVSVFLDFISFFHKRMA